MRREMGEAGWGWAMPGFLISIRWRTVVPFTGMRSETQARFVERCGFPADLGRLTINISENKNSNGSSSPSSYSSFCPSSLIILLIIYLGDTIIHTLPFRYLRVVDLLISYKALINVLEIVCLTPRVSFALYVTILCITLWTMAFISEMYLSSTKTLFWVRYSQNCDYSCASYP